MVQFNNPFEAHGYDSGLMDVAVQALKRGRNGEGEPVNVVVDGHDEIVELNPNDRFAIAHMVDHAMGVEAARTVGYGILGVILPKLKH
jgi:hypothetical protein